MPDKEKRKALYDTVSKDYDVGTYDEFSSKMDDPSKRKAFYNGVGKDYELGDFTSFENNVSLKKKDSGIVSTTPSVPTTTTTSEPEGFVQGSAPAPEGSVIKMPGERTDETIHENDPVQSALQSHRNEYSKTLNEFNNSGISQKQVSESTGQKVKPQQMVVGGHGNYEATLNNKLNTHIRNINNTYDKVSNQVLPNVDAAKDFIQKAADKNKGVIPEDNETVQVAAQKINDFGEREKNIAESGDLTSAAVHQAMKENPTLAKEIETIKKDHPDATDYKQILPGATVGKLVENFYKDKDNQDVINHHPEWQKQFDDLGKNNLTDNPEYGAITVGNELSRARQQEGKNNPVINVAFSGHSKYMDDLANRLYKDDPQKLKIYNDIVRNDYNKYIDTKDFVSGFAEGGKGVFRGMKNTFKELTGQGSDAETAQEDLKQQSEQVSSGAKGIYEYTDPAGKFAGMIAAMAGTGGVLKGIGASANLADKATIAGTFFGDEKSKFRLKYPGEPLKQNIGATLMTTAYMAGSDAFPSGKINTIVNHARPAMEDITAQLANGTLTKEAAKSKALYAFEQALNFGKTTATQSAKGIRDMTVITAFGQGLDKALGLKGDEYNKAHPDGELEDVAKSMLIGNLLPSALIGAAGIKSRAITKESLFDMVEHPKRMQNVMNDQMLTDPEAHSKMEAKIADLDHLVRTNAELKAHAPDLPVEARKQYILQEWNEKMLRGKAETITNPYLKGKIEDQIKKSEAIKENIFKGKGTDMLPQEDHLTSKEYKEVSDIKDDKELFDYFVNKGQKGYKTTLEAASAMEDEKTGVREGLKYMQEKAVENPVKFREDFGNDLTDKMLNRATTKELQASYMNLSRIDPDAAAIHILENLIEKRHEEGDIPKSEETEGTSNEEADTVIQPAKESQISVIKPGEIKHPETITIKPKENALQESGSSSQISLSGERGENIPTSSSGVRSGEQGTEATQKGESKSEKEGIIPPTGDELPFGRADTTGIAHTLQEERSHDTKSLPPQRGEGVTVEEAIKHGQDLLSKGGDAEKAAGDFKKDNKISYDSLSLVRAKHEELTRATNKAIDDFGENSKEAKEALDKESKWYKEVVKPMQTEWSKIGQAQQGEVDIDTGSYVGMRRAFREKTGREPNEKQAAEAKELSGKVKMLTQQVESLKKKLSDKVDESASKSDKVQKKSSADYTKERKDALQAARDALKKLRSGESGLGVSVPFVRELTAIAPHVAKIVKSLIEEGVEKLSDIVDFVHDQFKDDIEGLRRRDIMDVIAGDYSKKEEDKSPDFDKLSDIKQQVRLTKKLEDLQNDLPQDYDKNKTQQSEEVKILLAKIKKVKQDITEYKDRNNITTRFVEKKDNKFEAKDVKDIWEYAKKEYLDKNRSYKDMIGGVSTDLGLTPEQVRNALEQPKGAREITNEMYRKQIERDKAIQRATLWVKQSNTPKIVKALKAIPSFFFEKAIFGHGTVGMVTHAGMNIFRPTAWETYIPNFFRQFKYAFGGLTKEGSVAYEKEMENLTLRKNYILAKRAGLANDPHSVYDDYGGLKKFFGKLALAGDRGFNALKVYRQDLFDSIYDKASEVEKTDPEYAKEIAKMVNHSTGTSKVPVPETVGTAFFAPRLEASRWARLIVQPAKAIATLTHWENATPADKAAAKIVAKRSGEMLATYVALLAANQGILTLTGSNQKINFTNPSDSDWLKFKAGGANIDVSGGMVSTIDFIGKLIQASRGEKKEVKRDTKGAAVVRDIGKYARGKLSPFAGTAFDWFTHHDYSGNTLPAFNEKPDNKFAHKMTWSEYFLQQQTPIPVAEAFKDVAQQMKDKGMSDVQISNVLHGILVGVVSGGTGARVSEDFKAAEKKK